MLAASDASDRERRWAAQLGLRACRAIEEAETPTVACIHGHAIGGGFALAIACDFRIAADDCVFQVPEVDLAGQDSRGGIEDTYGKVHGVTAHPIRTASPEPCPRGARSGAPHTWPPRVRKA